MTTRYVPAQLVQVPGEVPSYLLQQPDVDGGRFTLEDGSGFILLESVTAQGPWIIRPGQTDGPWIIRPEAT